jgi:hypothetical protein
VSAYVDGVEIDKIPELAEVCAMDDWLDGLLAWTSENRPEMKMDVIFTGEASSLLLSEVWIGGAPPMRAQEVGGVLKSFGRPSHLSGER